MHRGGCVRGPRPCLSSLNEALARPLLSIPSQFPFHLPAPQGGCSSASPRGLCAPSLSSCCDARASAGFLLAAMGHGHWGTQPARGAERPAGEPCRQQGCAASTQCNITKDGGACSRTRITKRLRILRGKRRAGKGGCDPGFLKAPPAAFGGFSPPCSPVFLSSSDGLGEQRLQQPGLLQSCSAGSGRPPPGHRSPQGSRGIGTTVSSREGKGAGSRRAEQGWMRADQRRLKGS